MYHKSRHSNLMERVLNAYLSGCAWVAHRLNGDN